MFLFSAKQNLIELRTTLIKYKLNFHTKMYYYYFLEGHRYYTTFLSNSFIFNLK